MVGVILRCGGSLCSRRLQSLLQVQVPLDHLKVLQSQEVIILICRSSRRRSLQWAALTFAWLGSSTGEEGGPRPDAHQPPQSHPAPPHSGKSQTYVSVQCTLLTGHPLRHVSLEDAYGIGYQRCIGFIESTKRIMRIGCVKFTLCLGAERCLLKLTCNM